MAGTRWVRLDVDYFRNSKTLAVGRDGRAAHLASICWVGGQETDGHIPLDAVPTIISDAGASRRTVERLLATGLWLPNGDGYVLHDYLAIGNPSKESIEAERLRWREAKRKGKGA